MKHTTLLIPTLLVALATGSNAADTNSVSTNPPAYNLAATNALPSWAIGPFLRPSADPVIKPNPDSAFDCPLSKKPIHWEKAWVYNPAAMVKEGKIVVLYRAQEGPGNSCSRVGYAESDDGIHFKTDPAPVFYPDDDSQKSVEWGGGRNGGCEDPRLAESPDGTYILTYTQYAGGGGYRLGLASSKDLKHWTKMGSAFAGTKWENRGNKSASIVHELKDGRLVAAKINGKYWMYFGTHGAHVATSEDLIHWTPLENEKGGLLDTMQSHGGHFDGGLTEIGPRPILTKDGIVVFYNGTNDHGDPAYHISTYSGGEALFDKNDPTKYLARLDKPYITPELPMEKTGLYKDGTTFTEGNVFFKGKWFVYYGCADSCVGVAICDPKSP